NYLPFADNDRADRHLFGVKRQSCLPKRFAHEVIVADKIDARHLPDATESGTIRQVSTKAQVADLSPGRKRLRVSGADRVSFLHGQCTNDIQRLGVGDSCYAAFLNAKGKMRGEAYIVCRQDELLLDGNAGLQATLEKFVITEEVLIEDVSARLDAWLIVG